MRGAYFVLAIALIAGSAFADPHVFEWTPGSGGFVNHDGGEIKSIYSTFSPTTNVLTWFVKVGDVPLHPGLETDGFTLVLTDGPMPMGIAGELAHLFFDLTGPTPILTAYGYNALNALNSYEDGSPASGIQPPDRILSTLVDPTWATLIEVTNPDGTRKIGFSIDVTDILAYGPAHGFTDWFGIGYGDYVGVWMHTTAGLAATYAGGYLATWGRVDSGWVDGTFLTTYPMPEPGTVLLVGCAVTAAAWRLRRRKRAARGS